MNQKALSQQQIDYWWADGAGPSRQKNGSVCRSCSQLLLRRKCCAVFANAASTLTGGVQPNTRRVFEISTCNESHNRCMTASCPASLAPPLRIMTGTGKSRADFPSAAPVRCSRPEMDMSSPSLARKIWLAAAGWCKQVAIRSTKLSIANKLR